MQTMQLDRDELRWALNLVGDKDRALSAHPELVPAALSFRSKVLRAAAAEVSCDKKPQEGA